MAVTNRLFSRREDLSKEVKLDIVKTFIILYNPVFPIKWFIYIQSENITIKDKNLRVRRFSIIK